MTDWHEWLPMCQFALNTTVSSTTGITPFFANSAYHPPMDFDPPEPPPDDPSDHILTPNFAGNEYVRKMGEITQMLKENMRAAQETQERHSNKKRRPNPLFKAGDMVYLSAKNIVSERPSHKLDHQYHGPFKILSVHSHHCRLELPHEMTLLPHSRNNDVIVPATGEGMPGQTNPPPPAIGVAVTDDQLWGIQTSFNSRRTRNGFECQVRWRGYESSYDSWKPLANAVDATASMRLFHASNKKSAKSTKEEIKVAHNEILPTAEPASNPPTIIVITLNPTIPEPIAAPTPMSTAVELMVIPTRQTSRATKKRVQFEDRTW